jgi:hypothetical protein
MIKRLWLLAAALLPLTSAALAQDQADLARAAQNPVAAMISLPFQNTPCSGSVRTTTSPTSSTSSR